MLARIVPLLFCLAAAQAFAHPQGEEAHPSMLDCEHPPKGLVQVLPERVGVPARIECLPTAQSIVAPEGWNWRYPGSFFDRPYIPAYAPIASRQMGGPRFFTGFEAQELSADDARKQHETFTRDVQNYRETAPPVRLVKLVATNDLGHEMDAYFGFRSDREGWVMLCVPQCAPEYMFLMQKID